MKKTIVRKLKKGFTLVEIIVVISVIGILAAMTIPNLVGMVGTSKNKAISTYAKQYFVAAQTAVTNVNIAIRTGTVTTPFSVKEIKSVYYVEGENCVFYPGDENDVKKITTDRTLAQSQPSKYTVIPPLPSAVPDFSGKAAMNLNPNTSPYIQANGTDNNAVLLKNAMADFLPDPLKAEQGGFLIDGETGTGSVTPPTPPIVSTQNPVIVSVYNSQANNPSGTFVGRPYVMKVANIKYGIDYEVLQDGVKVAEFSPVTSDIVDLTGKLEYKPADLIADIQIREKNEPTRASNVFTRDLGFYYGNGSYKLTPEDVQDGIEDFYAISDPESLQVLSKRVARENVKFGSKNYKQVANIDMARGYGTLSTFAPVSNFVPIGEYDRAAMYAFKGVYDGGANANGTGYGITNLKINSQDRAVGLFGYASGGTLKNIRIGSGSIIKGARNTGGIVGTANIVIIQNCSNAATIEAVGGSSTGGGIAGSIANPLGSRIEGCSNTGRVTGNYMVGGIVGRQDEGIILNSYNTGAITGNDVSGGNNIGAVGGISAFSTSGGKIDTCYNTGVVNGGIHSTGGIIGENEGSISNSYNTGTIVSTSEFGVGGIVGRDHRGRISNCFNTANVSSTKNANSAGGVGGSFGYTSNTSVTNTKFKHSITVKGTAHAPSSAVNIPYKKIIEFVNATGSDRAKWTDQGKLVGVGGPNPGGVSGTATVYNTATTNPDGTFVGRKYELKIEELDKYKNYTVKLFEPQSIVEYETIPFTATGSTHTMSLTGRFKPTMVGTNGVHKIAVYEGTNEIAATTRDISFYYGNGSYNQEPLDAQNGTEDFYPISDPESLQALSVKVNGDHANFGGKNYKQVAIVDMAKGYKTPTTFEQVANFTPIGSQNTTAPFRGSYDGGAKADRTGYDIRNLKISGRNTYTSLFATVQDATLKNIGIGLGSVINGNGQSAAIGGRLNRNVVVTNCYNLGSVTSINQSAGGLFSIAAANTSISDCYNAGTIIGGSYAGGLIATFSGTEIRNCYNTGAVSGELYVGGIFADAQGNSADNTAITNCYNKGALLIDGDDNSGPTQSIGGIVGAITNGGLKITNCYNVGSITENFPNHMDQYIAVGGILGYRRDRGTVVIQNSYNQASIISNSTNTDDIQSGVGGIVGVIEGDKFTIKDSQNRNGFIITSKSAPVGGIVGAVGGQNGISIANVSNTANINGASYTGGIVGWIRGASYNQTSIINATNNAEISSIGHDFIGGIVGYAQSTNVRQCINEGKITGRNSVGGIIGYHNTGLEGSVESPVNRGVITGAEKVGGIIGESVGNFMQITSATNHETITATVSNAGGIVGRGSAKAGDRNVVIGNNIGAVRSVNGAGGIVGSLAGSNVAESINRAEVHSEKGSVGGIVGILDNSAVFRSRNYGWLGGTTTTDVMGGIVGTLKNTSNNAISRIEDCINDQKITGLTTNTNGGIGGIVGFVEHNLNSRDTGDVIITRCVNKNDITSAGAPVGGIAGNIVDKAQIINSKNIASITGIDAVGGIVGIGGGQTVIRDCNNLRRSQNASYSISSTGVDVGGIAGRMLRSRVGAKSGIENCANDAPVTGAGFVGGILGNQLGGDVSYSYNTGYITGTRSNVSSPVGGIVGKKSAGYLTTCYNTGDIKGNQDGIAGIIGLNYGGNFSNSYNTGTIGHVTVNPRYGISGITGYMPNSTATNCFTTGNVIGSYNTGASVGTTEPSLPSVIQNVKYNQKIGVQGVANVNANFLNVPYTHISEFLNATGADRNKWDNRGRLLNPDGSLMAGPNPGDIR